MNVMGKLGLQSGPGEHRVPAHIGEELATAEWQISGCLPDGASLGLCRETEE